MSAIFHTVKEKKVSLISSSTVRLSLFSSKQCIIKQLFIEFGFCDMRNNQGRGKLYQTKPKAESDNTYLDVNLDYSGYHKTKSKNSF